MALGRREWWQPARDRMHQPSFPCLSLLFLFKLYLVPTSMLALINYIFLIIANACLLNKTLNFLRMVSPSEHYCHLGLDNSSLRCCPVHCRMVSILSGLYTVEMPVAPPQKVIMTKYVSTHCQVPPGEVGKIFPI